MADHRGKAEFFAAFRCPPQHEAEGDRFFARHAEWIERTHPRDGELALLQYTVSKAHHEDGNALFLLAEVYQTMAGVENHYRLAHDEQGDPPDLRAFAEKCETIGLTGATVLHSLW